MARTESVGALEEGHEMERQTVIREVRSMLGAVPEFIDRIPDPHLGWMWRSMRDVQLQPGSIAAKVQQLVMLGASTSSKCSYGIDLHTELAKALGATPAEIVETALLAGHTAALGNYLGGTQYDLTQFKREVRATCQVLTGNGGSAPPPRSPGSGRSLIRQ